MATETQELVSTSRTTAADVDATTAAASGTGPAGVRVPACINWLMTLIVVMVGKLSEWVPGLGSIPLAKIAFLFAAVAALRARDSLPTVRVRSLRTVRPALAFMMLAVLSVTFSIFKSNTLVVSLLILILLLAMILLLKVTQTVRDVERLLFGFAAASASLSIALVLNYHGGRAFINDNFDPNDIAYALDSVLPIVLALRPERSRLMRLLMNALALMIVLSVVLTGSRGGAIGLAVVSAAAVAFPLGTKSTGELREFSIGRTLVRSVILAAAFAVAWGYLPVDTQQRMLTLVDLGSDYNADPTVNGSRTMIWRRDLGLALDRPIGYGLGSAEIVDGLHGGQYRTAHNSLLQAFVELGVLGLILYLASYWAALRGLGRLRQALRRAPPGEDNQKAALYARALRISLVGNLAAGFFLSQAYSPALWMIIATAAALVRVAWPESRIDESAPVHPDEPAPAGEST